VQGNSYAEAPRRTEYVSRKNDKILTYNGHTPEMRLGIKNKKSTHTLENDNNNENGR